MTGGAPKAKPVLVGRQRELDSLWNQFEQSITGHPASLCDGSQLPRGRDPAHRTSLHAHVPAVSIIEFVIRDTREGSRL
jgi:hypothetical protein